MPIQTKLKQMKNMSRKKYLDELNARLKNASPKKWSKGVYARGNKYYDHILPLKDNQNTKKNRAEAIKEFFGFDCSSCMNNSLSGLHQYAHHVNSSQLLCMMFFSKLVDVKVEATEEKVEASEEMVKFVKDAFGITIRKGAICDFEYKEKYKPYLFEVQNQTEYEGTSFDFHIEDGDTEVYFEIKFSEEKFGKAKSDNRHDAKAKQYLRCLPEAYKGKITDNELLDYYQIFRNIIRAKNDNKYVIFITDGANPGTNKDISRFIAFLKGKGIELPANVKFVTWQDIKDKYPCPLPFQFEALLPKIN